MQFNILAQLNKILYNERKLNKKFFITYKLREYKPKNRKFKIKNRVIYYNILKPKSLKNNNLCLKTINKV